VPYELNFNPDLEEEFGIFLNNKDTPKKAK